MVAKVLSGSKDKTIQAFHFHELSTHGLLSGWTQEEIAELLRALVSAGCLTESSVTRQIQGRSRTYRVLHLTALGARVMRAQEDGFEMVMPPLRPLLPPSLRARRRGSRSTAAAADDMGGPLSSGEAGLLERLRQRRRALSTELGESCAFVPVKCTGLVSPLLLERFLGVMVCEQM